MKLLLNCMAVLLLAFVLTLPAAALNNDETAISSNDDPEIGAVGSPVTEFSLTTYGGEEFTSADLKGKVTLLTFWFPT